MAHWILMEGHLVTEWRDDCIYKTKSVGYKWFNVDDPARNGFNKTTSVMWGSVSTKIMEKMGHKFIVFGKEAPPVPDWLPAYEGAV